MLCTCKYCGTEFTAQRKSAQYCKPAHRTAHYRMVQRVNHIRRQALTLMTELRNIASQHPQTVTVDVNNVMADILTSSGYHLAIPNRIIKMAIEQSSVLFQKKLELAFD
jgi:hypothetical protein